MDKGKLAVLSIANAIALGLNLTIIWLLSDLGPLPSLAEVGISTRLAKGLMITPFVSAIVLCGNLVHLISMIGAVEPEKVEG